MNVKKLLTNVKFVDLLTIIEYFFPSWLTFTRRLIDWTMAALFQATGDQILLPRIQFFLWYAHTCNALEWQFKDL